MTHGTMLMRDRDHGRSPRSFSCDYAGRLADHLGQGKPSMRVLAPGMELLKEIARTDRAATRVLVRREQTAH